MTQTIPAEASYILVRRYDAGVVLTTWRDGCGRQRVWISTRI